MYYSRVVQVRIAQNLSSLFRQGLGQLHGGNVQVQHMCLGLSDVEKEHDCCGGLD